MTSQKAPPGLEASMSNTFFKNMKGTLLHEDKEEDLESLNMSWCQELLRFFNLLWTILDQATEKALEDA